MKKRALYAYAVLLLIVFPAHALNLRVFEYLVPLYLVAVPLVLKKRIRMDISGRQAVLALGISLAVLLPYVAIVGPPRGLTRMGLGAAAFQLFAVALPEEIFFRGFLQDSLGNTVKAVVAVSLLFAVAHLPAFFLHGDINAALTFFPSLVMGFLYLRTSSVLPPTVFHFFANVVYLGSL